MEASDIQIQASNQETIKFPKKFIDLSGFLTKVPNSDEVI